MLLYVTKWPVDQTLNHFHAILAILEDQTRPLRLHHPSFRNFLLDKDRCNDPSFWVDENRRLADTVTVSSLHQTLLNEMFANKRLLVHL